MSVFNYKSKRDPLEGLRSRVSKIEKLLKRLVFWEVNDIGLGDDVLKRRKVTPSLIMGSASRGPWFKVDMGAGGGSDLTVAETDGSPSVAKVEEIRFQSGDFTVTDNGDKSVTISAWSKWEFGIQSIVGDKVTVNAGEVQDSLLNAKTASTAEITIAEVGMTYIFLEYTYGGAVEIKGSTTRPVMDATTYRRILHWWYLVDGVATLSKVSHIGNIVIPGTFASEA
jgi:hypothetical protein